MLKPIFNFFCFTIVFEVEKQPTVLNYRENMLLKYCKYTFSKEVCYNLLAGHPVAAGFVACSGGGRTLALLVFGGLSPLN